MWLSSLGLQYVPALLYVAIVTWLGLDLFFEARTGFIFGIPFAALVVLCIWAIIICSFKPRKRENGKKGIQLAVIVVVLAAIIGFDQWKRPYVRVICQLLDMEYRQDWVGIQKLARANSTMSNRPMACSYAISLVQTDQIAERMYDIRLDYDSLSVHGIDWFHNNASVL